MKSTKDDAANGIPVLCPYDEYNLSDDGMDSNHFVELPDGRRGMWWGVGGVIATKWYDANETSGGVGTCWKCKRRFRLEDMVELKD